LALALAEQHHVVIADLNLPGIATAPRSPWKYGAGGGVIPPS
jgi:hypothetical protein